MAGSYHHEDPPAPGTTGQDRRRNTAVAWARAFDRPLVHDKHSPADRPVFEDLQPQGWPELKIYVTADGWHLALAICRDLLNPHAVEALTEAGTNLVLVPAMSETLVPFGGPVAQRVGEDQALVVAKQSRPVAGIRASEGAAAGTCPGGPLGFGQLTHWVPGADATPGARLHVHSGKLT